MKINISKILKFCVLVLINIFFIFVVQFYFNMCGSLKEYDSNLKVSLFVNETVSDDKESIIAKLKNYNRFDIAEYTDFDSFDKFIEQSPELKDIALKEISHIPAFVTVNNLKAVSISEMENLKEELLKEDCIDDVVFDAKAYGIFFKYKKLFTKYREIFSFVFFIISAIFILKVLFFTIKGLYKSIFVEVLGGAVSAVAAYAVICLFMIADNDAVFVLDWKILYYVVPLGCMLSLITKEADDSNN